MASSNGTAQRPLRDTLASVSALIDQFIASLNAESITSADSSRARIDNPPPPLRVLSDSAKLLKAHTTKLSLLAINKPFTPSAVAKILQELAASCLPAMMSAVQICEQERATWGNMICKEAQMRVRRTLREMEVLLGEVGSISEGNAAVTRRDSLSSTGVVWESCDALIELEAMGVGGLALQKARQYRETIKDAIAELQEWVEGDDLATEGRVDALLDSDDEGVAGDKDSIDDIFTAANSMPADRPDLKALAVEADSKLKKIVILYNALEKRRLSIYRASPSEANGEQSIPRLDGLMSSLERIPHHIDDLASYLYDLDESGARNVLTKCIDEARIACKAMESDWNGAEDGFTPWLGKWENAVS